MADRLFIVSCIYSRVILTTRKELVNSFSLDATGEAWHIIAVVEEPFGFVPTTNCFLALPPLTVAKTKLCIDNSAAVVQNSSANHSWNSRRLAAPIQRVRVQL